MKTHPLPGVETQLLYRQAGPLQGSLVLEMIASAIAAAGLPPEACRPMAHSTETDVSALCGNFQILVTQSLPLEDRAHLDAAARNFTTQATFREAGALVRDLTGVIAISVNKGVLPHDTIPEGLRSVVGDELTTFCETGEVMAAMAIARTLTALLADQSPPDAVFWAPNLSLFAPEAFAELAGGRDPLALYLRPHLYAADDASDGQRSIGISVAGSQWLIGRSVGFKPSQFPVDYLAANALAFVSFCLKRDELLPDGDVFGRDENEKIRVLYHQSEGGRADEIELQLVHNPALGVFADDKPTIQHRYDDACELVATKTKGIDGADLDPDDPVDAAILEQLQEMRSAYRPPERQTRNARSTPHPRPAAATSAKTPAAPTGVPEDRQHEPADSRPRTSMRDLRAFALKSQVELPSRDAAKKRSPLLSRLFGGKSG